MRSTVVEILLRQQLVLVLRPPYMQAPNPGRGRMAIGSKVILVKPILLQYPLQLQRVLVCECISNALSQTLTHSDCCQKETE